MKNKPTNEQFQQQLAYMTDTLRNEIMEGKYASDTYLPSEIALSARFGLSNKSLRKGLDLLVEEGWITKIPRVGNQVKTIQSRITLNLACTQTIERDFELSGLLHEFQQQYPWISVKPTGFSAIPLFKDQGDTVSPAADADLIMLNDFHFQTLVEKNQYSMLEPLVANPHVYPDLNDLFSVGEQLYVQPLVFSPIVLCYNKAHFRECGLPEPNGSWTWRDLVKNAAVLSNGNGRFGFCFHLHSYNRWTNFLLQSGEHLGNHGEALLSDIHASKLMESIRVCKEIVLNRNIFPLYLSENNQDINDMFLEGKLSMVLNSYTGLNEFKHSKLEYDVSPVPFIHEPRALSFAIGAAVNKFSRFRNEARLLVDYLASQGQEFIHKHTTSIPCDPFIAEKQVQRSINFPSRHALFREMIFSLRWLRDLHVPTDAYPLLTKQLKAYWADMIDEAELAERILEEVLPTFRKAGS